MDLKDCWKFGHSDADYLEINGLSSVVERKPWQDWFQEGMRLYSGPTAAVTNNHRFSDSKQQKLIFLLF